MTRPIVENTWQNHKELLVYTLDEMETYLFERASCMFPEWFSSLEHIEFVTNEEYHAFLDKALYYMEQKGGINVG